MILWHRGRVVSAGCGNQFRPVNCRTGSVSVLPSRTGLPVRCVKTRKRRNKVTTVGCSDWCSQLLCTGRETFSISSQIIYRLNDTTVEETPHLIRLQNVPSSSDDPMIPRLSCSQRTTAPAMATEPCRKKEKCSCELNDQERQEKGNMSIFRTLYL